MRTLFLLIVCCPAFAQLPYSGSLSIKTAAGAGRSIAQEVNGNTSGNKSLSTLSVTAGKAAPHSMLEFRGYTSIEAPGAPQSVSATDIYGDGIYIYWSAPSTGDPVNHYLVYFSIDGGDPLPLGVQSSPYVHPHSELSGGATYQYYVFAVNDGGTSQAGISNSITYPY